MQRPPPPTHFICIPLYTSRQIQDSVRQFHQRHEHLALPRSVAVPVSKLHLTLAVLSLPTKVQLDECVKVLDYFAAGISPVTTHLLRTLNIGRIKVLRGSPRRARVVYASAAAPPNVMTLIRALVQTLKSHRLIPDHLADDPFLHMTLFNTKYDRKVDFIDVHEMETDVEFGQFPFDSLHLCAMSAQADRTLNPRISSEYHAASDDENSYPVHHIVRFSRLPGGP